MEGSRCYTQRDSVLVATRLVSVQSFRPCCSNLSNFNYKPQVEGRQQHLALYMDCHLRSVAIMIEVTSHQMECTHLTRITVRCLPLCYTVIDKAIEISSWLSLISNKRSPPCNYYVYGCFASRCRQFQPQSFFGKIFTPFSEFSDFTRSLLMGARN